MTKIPKTVSIGMMVGGTVCALVSCVLLITATVQIKWITYAYSQNLGVATIVAVIDIGLWKAEGTALTTPIIGAATTTVISGDTTDYDYFDTSLIKLCRAFAILGIISIFSSSVLAVLSQFIQKLTKPFLIASVSAATFTVLLLMIAMLMLKGKLLSGMATNTSYDLGIAADIMAGIAAAVYTLVLILTFKGIIQTTATVPSKNTTQSNIEQQTERKQNSVAETNVDKNVKV